MKVNDRLFKGILVMLGILVIAGYAFVSYLRLDEPVFLEHYYDVEIYGDEDIYETPVNIKYITNADDEREVIGIVFPDHPDLFFQATENVYEDMNSFQWDQSYDIARGITYGPYNVRDVYLEVQGFSGVDDLNNTVLREATIFFSDSSEMTVDLGEIRLYTIESEESILYPMYSSWSSNGVGEVRYTMQEDMLLIIEDDQHNDFIDSITDIQVNGLDVTDSQEIDINEGDTLSITTVVEPPEDILHQYQLNSPMPEMTYIAEDGTLNSLRLASIYNAYPQYNFTSIYEYLRARGEI